MLLAKLFSYGPTWVNGNRRQRPQLGLFPGFAFALAGAVGYNMERG